MGARGPKGMTPQRQELAQVRKSRRTGSAVANAASEAAKPLDAKPPTSLGADGKRLWIVVSEQQKSLRARGLAPTVTAAEAPLLQSYCVSFERFLQASKVIKARESEYPASQRWRARMIDLDDGDQKLHGAYRTEREEAAAMAKMAAALGVAKNAPAIAVQVNQSVSSPPADGLLAMDRLSADVAEQAGGEVIDAT